MFWWKPDVLCANHLAKVRLTRLSRLRCREANTLGVRSAYPLASACCRCGGMVGTDGTNEKFNSSRRDTFSVPRSKSPWGSDLIANFTPLHGESTSLGRHSPLQIRRFKRHLRRPNTRPADLQPSLPCPQPRVLRPLHCTTGQGRRAIGIAFFHPIQHKSFAGIFAGFGNFPSEIGGVRGR